MQSNAKSSGVSVIIDRPGLRVVQVVSGCTVSATLPTPAARVVKGSALDAEKFRQAMHKTVIPELAKVV